MRPNTCVDSTVFQGQKAGHPFESKRLPIECCPTVLKNACNGASEGGQQVRGLAV